MLIKGLKRWKAIKFAKHYTYKDVDADILFNVIKDIDNYKYFVPLCSDSKILNKVSEYEFDAMLEINYRIFVDSYISKVMCEKNIDDKIRYKIISKSIDESIFEYLNSSWYFWNDGLNLEIDYEIAFKFRDRFYDTITNSLKGIIANTTMRGMIKEARKRQVIINEEIKKKTREENYKVDWILNILKANRLHDLENDVNKLLKNQNFKAKLYNIANFYDDKHEILESQDAFIDLIKELCFQYRSPKF